MKNLKSMTLEISLKPFYSTEPAQIEAVCRQFFQQWASLLEKADELAVLFFAADGSEILEYQGVLDAPFEWASFIGGANERRGWDKTADPQGLGLHTTCYWYRQDAPRMTYRNMKDIVAITRHVGQTLTGKTVRIGAMFDPGPEFARSDFKYRRHPEILLGNTMGKASFVCCYSTLNKDDRPYAGFPQGIPDNTPFGHFFGRQCHCFLSDLGFDYLWLGNGFGFGSESWGTTGALFDGQRFYPEKMHSVRQQIVSFWQLFRQECRHPVETRGTNLTAGIDLATDGVDLMQLYSGEYDLLPPPNSPWAALNGDFGLEIAGFLSRTALLPPGDHFLYRFYVHDPWWMNSPWLDRYEGQPHDIYLPLATARLNQAGKACSADHLNLLTIDNSLGEMPDQCPLEVIPHLLKAFEQAPDAPAPLVWVYPFRTYHELAAGRLSKPFFEDWLIRDAINAGVPISMVMDSELFAGHMKTDLEKPIEDSLFSGAVLVMPVPESGSILNEILMAHVMRGGQVLLYGSMEGADAGLLRALNLAEAKPLTGVFQIGAVEHLPGDTLMNGTYAAHIDHDPILADGGLAAVLQDGQDSETIVIAEAVQQKDRRILALDRAPQVWQGGRLLWLRGSNSGVFRGGHLLEPRSPAQIFPTGMLFRQMLGRLGWSLRLEKDNPDTAGPVCMIHRHDQAYYYSFYVPDTTVGIELRHPLGAPLLIGQEAIVHDDKAVYHFPRAARLECRVFVCQPGRSVLSCRETAPVSFQMGRRLHVTGLVGATVVYLPPAGIADQCEVLLNSRYPHMTGDPLQVERIVTRYGPVLTMRQVTGSLMLSTPRSDYDLSLRLAPQADE